jgi:hypothetical protein
MAMKPSLGDVSCYCQEGQFPKWQLWWATAVIQQCRCNTLRYHIEQLADVCVTC